MIFWKLEVDLEVFLGSDGPYAVDGRVVRAAVVQPVGADVGSADEVLRKLRHQGFFLKLKLNETFSLTGFLIQKGHFSAMI